MAGRWFSSPRTGAPFPRPTWSWGLPGFARICHSCQSLRLALDLVLQAPSKLAPQIDPNVHTCASVPPHGAAELTHPDEPDAYVVGMKSYGRAPTFLALTGYEQVRSVAAELAGDREAARPSRTDPPRHFVAAVDRRRQDQSKAL